MTSPTRLPLMSHPVVIGCRVGEQAGRLVVVRNVNSAKWKCDPRGRRGGHRGGGAAERTVFRGNGGGPHGRTLLVGAARTGVRAVRPVARGGPAHPGTAGERAGPARRTPEHHRAHRRRRHRLRARRLRPPRSRSACGSCTPARYAGAPCRPRCPYPGRPLRCRDGAVAPVSCAPARRPLPGPARSRPCPLARSRDCCARSSRLDRDARGASRRPRQSGPPTRGTHADPLVASPETERQP